MANVRIIYNNAGERAIITASTTASGSLAAGTLSTNPKSLAHRSTGNSVTYTLTWANSEEINGVIIPAINLSSTATIRVRTYINSGSTLKHDSGTIPACTDTPLNTWYGIKNVNAFPYGGLSKVAVWLSTTYSVTSMIIDIIDTNNFVGYIDCSRIVCGKYWEPSYNVSKNGLELTINDTTQTSRSDAGDLISDRGTIHEIITFNLEVINKTDKEQLISIMRYIGTYRNIAVSIIPSSNNNRDEQDYIIYGKRDNSSIGYLVHNFYQNSFSITGW